MANQVIGHCIPGIFHPADIALDTMPLRLWNPCAQSSHARLPEVPQSTPLEPRKNLPTQTPRQRPRSACRKKN